MKVFMGKINPSAEITIECDPNTFDLYKLRAFH